MMAIWKYQVIVLLDPTILVTISAGVYTRVCVYYKNLLLLRVLDMQYLHECINFELKIGEKLCNFVALYISPSQAQEEFEKVSDTLELNLGNLSQKIPF